MQDQYTLSAGIVKVVSGLVECAETEPYISAIKAADERVGVDIFAKNEAAQRTREHLTTAIKLNLANRKDYPYSLLRRQYNLPVSYGQFTAIKRRYCWEIATALNLEKKEPF